MVPRSVLAPDHPAVARALAEAFAEDPVIAWLVSGEVTGARPEVLAPAFFTPALRAGGLRGHAYVLDGDDGGGGPVGAAVWSPPDTPMFRRSEGAALAEAVSRHGTPGGVDRLSALAEVNGRHHPTEPHFYLFLLGLVPGSRSRGLGSVLLAPVLARCDAEGLPAHLESSNPRNVTFYERQGFETVWEDAPDGGPLLRGMRRAPRPLA